MIQESKTNGFLFDYTAAKLELHSLERKISTMTQKEHRQVPRELWNRKRRLEKDIAKAERWTQNEQA